MRGTDARLAVIDIGSNTGKMIVVRRTRSGHLETLADAQAPLRLVRDVGARRSLSAASIERTLGVLRNFRSVAEGAGASRIRAVATSAVREAANGADLVARARRELGVGVEILDGSHEARYAFLGAVHGLPVEHGLVLDLGGGSLQISHFRRRRLRRAWTFPLGALRLSDRFLAHDPPTPKEIRRLRKIVSAALRKAGVPALRADEHLVGTGGTIRNLAKMDRRRRAYPVPRLHGYVLARESVEELAAVLASQRRSKRRAIPGLNADRVDSIVGGALTVQTVMEAIEAAQMVVAGQGLREGLALGISIHGLRPPRVVRQASVIALASRFATWDARAAARRAGLAFRLMEALEPRATPELRELLGYAAMTLDIGQSVDHFKRYEHAAMILMATDLAGFSHRQIARLSAIVVQAGNGPVAWGSYRPLLRAEDQGPIARASVILALADEIGRRWSAHEPPALRCERRGGVIVLTAPPLGAWLPRRLSDQFEGAFGRPLVVEAMRRHPAPPSRRRRPPGSGRRRERS